MRSKWGRGKEKRGCKAWKKEWGAWTTKNTRREKTTNNKEKRRKRHGEMPRKAVRKENTKGCGRERRKAG